MEKFIQNIIELREKHGLTKSEMSDIMHVSPSAISKIERGEIPKRMNVDVVFYLSDHFGIPCDILMGREDS